MQSPSVHGQFRSLAFTSLGHFINDGEVFFVPLIADIFASGKGVSPLEITIFFVVFYASASILSAYVGRLADKTGEQGPMIGLGLALLSIGLLGFYGSIVYLSGFLLAACMIVSSFFAGFGSAFYHPLAASILQSEFQEATRGRALGLNGSIGSIGRAFYPTFFFLLGVVLINYGSIAFIAFIGLLASAAISLGLRKTERPANVPTSPSHHELRTRDAITRGIVLLTCIALVRSLATQGIVAWIPIYMSTQRGLGMTTSLGFALTMMYVAPIFGQPLLGWILDRVDKRLVLASVSAGSGFSILGYILTNGHLSTVILSVFGLFTFSAFPILLSIAPDYQPQSSSLGNALVWGIGTSGGSIVGPIITGAIVLNNYANLGLAFEVMAVAALIAAVGTVFLPKTWKRRKVVLSDSALG